MNTVDEAVVRRSNALGGYHYGSDFAYQESIPTGRGLRGLTLSLFGRVAFAVAAAIVVFPPTRVLLLRLIAPPKGGGPKIAVEGRGSFRLQLLDARSGTARVTIEADHDPGYGATAIMIGEAALLLAEARTHADGDILPSQGGVLTPAAAFGRKLVDRVTRAGVRFIEHTPHGTTQGEDGI
jgi:short subunit dehydrogenase-like uncharacterized protein